MALTPIFVVNQNDPKNPLVVEHYGIIDAKIRRKVDIAIPTQLTGASLTSTIQYGLPELDLSEYESMILSVVSEGLTYTSAPTGLIVTVQGLSPRMQNYFTLPWTGNPYTVGSIPASPIGFAVLGSITFQKPLWDSIRVGISLTSGAFTGGNISIELHLFS